ncbi:SAM-dependent methyltransferase [Nonomuraea jabiensis]|uniref:SAM-dependent methyltransferase n=1 Tax=Nonomuraea jabiensis TaxID=882448 RepID=UPI003D73CFB9
MTQPAWFNGVNPKIPSVARIYDFMLGGKDNFEADRAAAKVLTEKMPNFRATARENRWFLQRVLRHLLAAGVRQILDIGTGLPTAGNVHEIASTAKVVYVDNDPDVLVHARALLADTDRVRVIGEDARDPDAILTHPEVRDFLDWREPVGVLMIGLLHFIPDADGAYDIVERIKAALSPGGYVAISHGTEDYRPRAEWMQTVQEQYRSSNAQPIMRSYEQILPFFEGCDMVEPGLVNVLEWHPGGTTEGRPPEQIPLYGGVGKIVTAAAA